MSSLDRVKAVDKRIYGGKSDVNQLSPIVYKSLWQAFLDANDDHWGLTDYQLSNSEAESVKEWLSKLSSSALRARYLSMTIYRMTSSPEYRQYILRAIDELTVNVEAYRKYFDVDPFSSTESNDLLVHFDCSDSTQSNFTVLLAELIKSEIFLEDPTSSSQVVNDFVKRVNVGILNRAATHYSAYEIMVTEVGTAATFSHNCKGDEEVVTAISKIRSSKVNKSVEVIETLDWE